MPRSGYGKDSHNFRRTRVFLQPSASPPELEAEVFDLTAGIRVERSPREIPLNSTPFMEGLRFEGTGIRNDYGLTDVGMAAGSRVIGLADHKYYKDEQFFHRIMRIVRSGSNRIFVETWDGTQWLSVASPAITVDDVMLSMVSTQNKLVFADGQNIWMWEEPTPSIQTAEKDFAAGNDLDTAGESTEVSITEEAVDDQYEITYDVRLAGDFDPGKAELGDTGSITLKLEIAVVDALNRTEFSLERVYSINGGFPEAFSENWLEEKYTLDKNNVNGRKIRLKVTEINQTGPVIATNILVHGYNKTVDGDSVAGVVYQFQDDPGGSVVKLSADAPAATFIIAFGDRLLALQDTNNPQQLAVSLDGNIRVWTGEGTDKIQLLDSSGDAIDDLMCAGFVANNVLALIRRRSIMRVSETGQVDPPISVVHWIEGIGTESPHSLAQARDGIMFLGHNLMVYYFDGSQRPVPVGIPIHEFLIRTVTANLEIVDATYDPVRQEFLMAVPENGADENTRIWIFDVGSFLDEQELKWRSRLQKVQRFATVSRL